MPYFFSARRMRNALRFQAPPPGLLVSETLAFRRMRPPNGSALEFPNALACDAGGEMKTGH